ncbi:ribbon-helix-helix domain-containing protein [Bauldia sp.]|uniref:ribbon-helix-helix domain-containing protein n=1 Tax=Bauldia sp. TaxID=2575872 RepID=UPI003BAB9B63
MKRSITIAGHRTSIWIEDPFWHALGEIASERGESIATTIASIDRGRSPTGNLSSAIRVFVLDHYRRAPASGKP